MKKLMIIISVLIAVLLFPITHVKAETQSIYINAVNGNAQAIYEKLLNDKIYTFATSSEGVDIDGTKYYSFGVYETTQTIGNQFTVIYSAGFGRIEIQGQYAPEITYIQVVATGYDLTITNYYLNLINNNYIVAEQNDSLMQDLINKGYFIKIDNLTYEEGIYAGQQQVIQNPNNYNLFTQEQRAQYGQQQYNNGYSAGIIANSNTGFAPVVFFNQLIQNDNYLNKRNENITLNYDSESYLYHYENNNIVGDQGYLSLINNLSIENNHKYYLYIQIKNTESFLTNNDFRIQYNNGSWRSLFYQYNNEKNRYNVIVDLENVNEFKILMTPEISNINIDFYKPNLIDLTLMFGEGKEPSLEECNDIFISNYYNYSSGKVVNIGYESGYEVGNRTGYNEGVAYQKAISGESGKNFFVNIFEGIGSFFKIELFPGISFGLILGIPFIISVAWFVIRSFRGGE